MREKGFEHIKQVLWTPAHRSDEEIGKLDQREREIALGNKEADLQAKAVVEIHPPRPKDLDDEIVANLRKARCVVNVFVVVSPLFEPAKHEKAPRPPRQPRRQRLKTKTATTRLAA